MSEQGLKQSNSFDTSRLVEDLTMAAFQNQKVVNRLTRSLEETVRQLRDDIPPAIVEEIRDGILAGAKLVLADAAISISAEVSKHLNEAQQNALAASKAFRAAAESYTREAQAAFIRVALVAAVVSIAFSALVTLIAFRLR